MNTSRSQLPTRVESSRLFVRRYEHADGPMYYQASKRNAKHLLRYESENPVMNLAGENQATDMVRQLCDEWGDEGVYFLAIIDKTTKDWAGQVYVALTNRDLPEYVIGYVADVRYEGKGYICEAVAAVLRVLFNKLDAHRVKSDCNEYNVRSWRLLERCGFTREGHLRENRRNPDGTVHGDFLYGLLKSEFEKKELI